MIAAVVLLSASPVLAQPFYKWRDEKGQWQLSDRSPQALGYEATTQSVPGLREVALGRSYAGITLGQQMKAFLSKTRATEEKNRAAGVKMFRLEKGQWPPGAIYVGVGFMNDRLALVKVVYGGKYTRSTGGWTRLLERAEETHGPTNLRHASEWIWYDDATGLTVARDFGDMVHVTHGDRGLVDDHRRLRAVIPPEL
jgi:hypothetical protein